MQIKAIRNKIIVQFLDQINSDGTFTNRAKPSSSMLIMPTKRSDFSEQSVARWAVVTSVGSEVAEIAIGDYVLIEPLKWTTSVEVDGQKYWQTEEQFIMAITNDINDTYL